MRPTKALPVHLKMLLNSYTSPKKVYSITNDSCKSWPLVWRLLPFHFVERAGVRSKYWFTILLFVTTNVQAQTKPVENLVFEGAGIRGIAYAGAIKSLEQKGKLQYIKRVGGTSAGAITALLLSLNYSANEIAAIVNSTPYKKFNDGKFFFIGGLVRLNKWYGWYKGKRFESWLKGLIGAKTGNPNSSFLQLHQSGGKDLYVTGTCLNKQKTIVFSYETYPDMRVLDAVRISMSIPFYFEAVFIDSAGTVIEHPKNKTGLDVMLDGGFTANFPITLFDSSRYVGAAEKNYFVPNVSTIGFRIDSDAQIKSDSTNKSLAPMPITNFNQYTTAFYTLILENLNRQTLTSYDWQRTISISDGGIGPRIRKLKKREVEALVENGRTATEKYFIKD